MSSKRNINDAAFKILPPESPYGGVKRCKGGVEKILTDTSKKGMGERGLQQQHA